jgi:membrane-bound lytic murein transglycosylase D
MPPKLAGVLATAVFFSAPATAFALDASAPPGPARSIPPFDTLMPELTLQALFTSGTGDPRFQQSSFAQDLTANESADLWDRIRAGSGLSNLDSELVSRHESAFVRQPDYLARIVERSRRYLFFIVAEVERRRMPSEIALLPIVESAFNPTAFSRSRASGIWQFIPSTGEHYGMSQNWWYDGRRDIVAATTGALDYLQKLYAQFGSWELALAAYNCGEGKVARLISRNEARGLPTDYLHLPLPVETRNYVPKLLAARNIVANPSQFGLTLAAIPNQPYFAAVTTIKHIDRKRAAEFAEISEEEFTLLNPAYNRPVITAHEERTILVPAETAEFFAGRLQDPEARLVSWRTHKLRRGESLDRAAERFGLTGAALKQINGISGGKKVAGGGTILVPSAEMDAQAELVVDGTSKPESDVPSPLPPVVMHRMQRGESLARIAHRYGVTVAQIKTWNHLRGRQHQGPGRTLVIHRPAVVLSVEQRGAPRATRVSMVSRTRRQ